jgi:hypothetical protein
VLLFALGTASCESGDAETTTPTPTADPSCVGEESGDVRLSQGHPTNVPGGGRMGINTVDMTAEPPTVTLIFGGARPGEAETGVERSVGDTVTLQGHDYEVLQICAGSVSLQSL